MRRAEKAGRGDAAAWIATGVTPARIERDVYRIAQGEAPSAAARAETGEAFDLYIGAHQLTGRAYLAALEAYDRGYIARLKEALSTLTEKEVTS